MELVGGYLSPFARRSAVVLKALDLDFEQRPLSTAQHPDEVTAINPLCRIPALVLDGEEALIDSAAIIDYALEVGDADHALLPASGADRRAVLRHSAVATGTMEKAVASAYERHRRPKDKIHPEWLDHVNGQVAAGLTVLDSAADGRDWLHGDHMTLADINAVVAFDFVAITSSFQVKEGQVPALAALSERCNALASFAETQAKR